MALKKRLTTEQHRAAARTIRTAQLLLDALLQELLTTYGTSSRIGKIAEHLYASGRRYGLDELRCRLDEAFCAEGHSHLGHRSPYYGPQNAQAEAGNLISLVEWARKRPPQGEAPI